MSVAPTVNETGTQPAGNIRNCITSAKSMSVVAIAIDSNTLITSLPIGVGVGISPLTWFDFLVVAMVILLNSD
jgi:hypothetical protein